MIEPMIIMEDFSGGKPVSLQTYLLKERKIFLTGPIDSETATLFIQELMYLQSVSEEPISVIINSTGGEVWSGLAIRDAIAGAKNTVDLYCTGMAASMAAVILACGKKGHRFILPHSRVLIHEPLQSGRGVENASSISRTATAILETRDILNSLLAAATGKTLEEINEATSYDNEMSAEKAIEFGLCDKIVTSVSYF